VVRGTLSKKAIMLMPEPDGTVLQQKAEFVAVAHVEARQRGTQGQCVRMRASATEPV
jgi:hypothetical protein